MLPTGVEVVLGELDISEELDEIPATEDVSTKESDSNEEALKLEVALELGVVLVVVESDDVVVEIALLLTASDEDCDAIAEVWVEEALEEAATLLDDSDTEGEAVDNANVDDENVEETLGDEVLTELEEATETGTDDEVLMTD